MRNYYSKLLSYDGTKRLKSVLKLTFGHEPFGPGFNVFIVFVVCRRSSSPAHVNVLVFKVQHQCRILLLFVCVL